ncbi:polysaccharide deacetylase family protein [Tahibacter amnicola]|uniref:Polysaccharide deacetylase family protein n=1 Tax=Tahibacter amnicola TaxID=2976241 RepID=A0ABY6BD23_9GAMM|nr:polysaccharide deacetylase family protein [Tahibacter amnicola]UXI67725.1 polysaccharide deacetylase family protein [Tahibacter amnicola]
MEQSGHAADTVHRDKAVSLHRVPRFPHAWLAFLAATHLAGICMIVVGQWLAGTAVLLSAQGLLFWGTLWPTSRMLSPVLCRLPTDERVVWLTIDDGPSDDTLAILDLLDRHAAKAGFFVVGERAAARPDVLREIVHRGHLVGNHSYDHPERVFWALPPWAIAHQIGLAQDTLAHLTGQRPRWFRAVVGMANPFVAAVLRRHGLARVAWSARAFDTRCADPQEVIVRLDRRLAPGAILLMHERSPHGRSVEAIAAVLDHLSAKGYRCVLPESAATADAKASSAHEGTVTGTPTT